MPIAIILVLLAGLNSTIGNLMLKQSRISPPLFATPLGNFVSLWFVGAIFFYVVNVFLFGRALDRIPVAVGYPILAGSGFVMLAIGSAVFFGERFGFYQFAGLALVFVGIVCLARTG
jgi:multidrug transporter EmrE-like cation transporter